jgi:transcriptional regulator with XRE-family HTH domain
MSDMAKREEEVLELLRRRVHKSASLRQAAIQFGVSAQYLSDVLCGRRRLGPTLLKALGYRLDRVTISRLYVES